MENQRFEELLAQNKRVFERFVHFRLPTAQDAEDILAEVYLTAFEKRHQLKDEASFKAWVLRIASNKCNDFYRRMATVNEIDLEDLVERIPAQSRFGLTEQIAVRQTLSQLKDEDHQVLFLYYFKQNSISEIARTLHLPQGTVKSRLFTARANFKKAYQDENIILRGEKMKKLPKILPSYSIKQSEEAPFEVKWEELMGWFLVPRLGEKLTWAMYDLPERKMTDWYHVEAVGKARVHGIEGVEILAREHNLENMEHGEPAVSEHRFVAQLTDTHCRFLAESHMDDGVKVFYTFLDGDEFLPNWGFGPENCGNEVHLKPKGLIRREGRSFTSPDLEEVLDVVGRFTLTINGKDYDTICVVDLESYDQSVMTEQFIDRNGRTLLWRRFNADDWHVRPGQLKWRERLPLNEQYQVNGKTFVHWYDCLTDYLFSS